MTIKHCIRIACVMLLSACLLLSVSCRDGGEEQQTTAVTADVTTEVVTSQTEAVTSQTEAVTSQTETETSQTETVTSQSETAVTEPPLPEAPTKAEICEAFNQGVLRLFSDEAAGEGTEAEKMMEIMLPYLMGSGESTPLADSYHMSNVTVTGDADVLTIPREIYCIDGIKTAVYEDAEIGVYREIEVSRETGTVYLSTLDGITAVDSISINDDSSPFGELKAETLTVIEQQLSEASADSYTVANKYIRDVLNALFGADTVTKWSSSSMSATLHVGEYRESGAMTMQITLTEPVAIRIVLRLDGMGHSRESLDFVLTVGEDTEIRMVGEMTDGAMSGMHMSIRMGEQTVEATQTVSGNHTELNMSTKSGGMVDLSYRMALDMVSETEGKGTVEVTFRVGEDPSPGFTLLSARDTTVESVAKGDFAVRVRDGELELLEMEVTATAATVTTKTRMFLTQSGAAVGESVMYYAVTLQDSADPTASSSMEMEVKLTAVSGDVSTYALGMSATDSSGTSTVKATVTTGDGARPSYTADEEKLIGRAKALLRDPTYYEQQAQDAVDALIRESVTRDITAMSYPFYLEDQDGDGIVVLIELVESDGYYLYADVLLDVENYTYWYCRYDRYFGLSKRSGFYENRNWLAETVNGYDSHQYWMAWSSNAIGYYYNAEQGIYIYCDLNDLSRCGYSLTEPVAADFPGRVLHKVTVDERGRVVGDIHDLQTEYDGNCVATLSCRTCSYRITANAETHDDVPLTLLCEQHGRQPKTTFNACSRCGRNSLTLTDGEGDSLLVLLDQATYASITMENTFRFDPVSWEWVGSRRDLTDCLIVSDITWGTNETAPSRTFDCDIILPDLRGTLGKTILGIRFDDNAYRITTKPGLTVVFPDGMEYIGCYGSVLFSNVTELTLPESLICLSDGALGGYAGERLVLPASLAYFPDDGFQMMNLKSLTIKGAYYEISPYLWCPELEELICEGTFDIFRGFGTPCKIEEFTVPAGVKIISAYAFSRMESLKRVVLPEGLTEIERQAFEDCKNLTEIVLPASLERIGGNAFSDCDALTRVEMPGIKVIGSNAFWSCDILEEVLVGDALTTVERGAFIYCKSLKRIHVPASASVASDAFAGCESLP